MIIDHNDSICLLPPIPDLLQDESSLGDDDSLSPVVDKLNSGRRTSETSEATLATLPLHEDEGLEEGDNEEEEAVKCVRFCQYDEVLQIPSWDEDVGKDIWYSREDLFQIKRDCCNLVVLSRKVPQEYEQSPEMFGLHKFTGVEKELIQRSQLEAMEVVLDLQCVLRDGGMWNEPTAEAQMSMLYAQVCEDAVTYALHSGLLLEWELYGYEMDDSDYEMPLITGSVDGKLSPSAANSVVSEITSSTCFSSSANDSPTSSSWMYG